MTAAKMGPNETHRYKRESPDRMIAEVAQGNKNPLENCSLNNTVTSAASLCHKPSYYFAVEELWFCPVAVDGVDVIVQRKDTN